MTATRVGFEDLPGGVNIPPSTATLKIPISIVEADLLSVKSVKGLSFNPSSLTISPRCPETQGTGTLTASWKAGFARSAEISGPAGVSGSAENTDRLRLWEDSMEVTVNSSVGDGSVIICMEPKKYHQTENEPTQLHIWNPFLV